METRQTFNALYENTPAEGRKYLRIKARAYAKSAVVNARMDVDFAKDIFQATFIKMCSSAAKFESLEDILAYWYKTINNAVIDYNRKQAIVQRNADGSVKKDTNGRTQRIRRFVEPRASTTEDENIGTYGDRETLDNPEDALEAHRNAERSREFKSAWAAAFRVLAMADRLSRKELARLALLGGEQAEHFDLFKVGEDRNVSLDIDQCKIAFNFSESTARRLKALLERARNALAAEVGGNTLEEFLERPTTQHEASVRPSVRQRVRGRSQ